MGASSAHARPRRATRSRPRSPARCRRAALARFGTVRDADPRVEQAQIVGDLGDRADRRARALAEPLLLDGQWPGSGPRCSRPPVSAIDQGIAGHRPIATRRSGAAPRRRWYRTPREDLPEPPRPGDHHQPVSRQLAADVLQVVLPSSPDDQGVHRGVGGAALGSQIRARAGSRKL